MSTIRTPATFVLRTGRARLALGTISLLVAALVVPASPASAAATYVDLGTAASYSILGGTGVANTGDRHGAVGKSRAQPDRCDRGIPARRRQRDHSRQGRSSGDRAVRPSCRLRRRGQSGQRHHIRRRSGRSDLPSGRAQDNCCLHEYRDHHSRRRRRPKRRLRLPDRGRVQFGSEHEGRVDRWGSGEQRLLAGGRRCPLGAGAEMVGTFLGAGAITFGDGASIKGRALTPGTVAVTNSPFTEPVDDFDAPIVTIDGGATRSTNDTTPSISGTTDEPAGKHVTVGVAGQTLIATVVDGGPGMSARVHSRPVRTAYSHRSPTPRRTSAPPVRF